MTSNIIVVRQMNENDLEQADKIMKLACFWNFPWIARACIVHRGC
jgi:hypothetical protein